MQIAPRGRFPNQTRAFTLIEIMIALVVMLLTFLAMLAVVPFAFTNVQTNAIEVQAVAVGQRFLDDERNAALHHIAGPTVTTVPIDAGESLPGEGTPDAGYGNFTVTPDGCTTAELPGNAADDFVGTYLCSVSVSWIQSRVTRTVAVQSFVTK